MPPDDSVPAGFEDFELAMRRHRKPVESLVGREVYGTDDPVYGYTTPAQAEALADRLTLRPGMRLLDIGAGRGWPSLHLAKISGCQSVLSDVPAVGLREAMARAQAGNIPAEFVRASGERPPFRPASFYAVVHTDVL